MASDSKFATMVASYSCFLLCLLLCADVLAAVTIVDLGGAPGSPLTGAGPFSQSINGATVGVSLLDHASQATGDVLARDNDFFTSNPFIRHAHFADSSVPRWRFESVNGATGDLTVSVNHPNRVVYLYLVDVDHFDGAPDAWSLQAAGQPLVASRYLGTVDNTSNGRPDRIVGSSNASSLYGIAYDPATGELSGSTSFSNSESISIFEISGLREIEVSAINASTTQFFLGVGSQLHSGILPEEVQQRRYASYALESLDTLISFGHDRYGASRADELLVANLDVVTRRQPVSPDQSDVAWRVGGRNGRRSPAGANLWQDQDTIGALKKATTLTGDPKYGDFADGHIHYYSSNFTNESTGMYWWGIHQWYDIHDESFKYQNGNDHEIHAPMAGDWQAMWDVDPVAVRSEVEQIWERHVIHKTGQYAGLTNRHDDPVDIHAFVMSSGAFVEAFAFMEKVSLHEEQQVWRERARLLANYNRVRADPLTGLLPDDVVADTPYTTGRFDEGRSSSTLPGQYSFALLRAYQFNGDQVLLDDAVAYLTSWADHAYDPTSGRFWGSLELNGTPVQGPRVASGYDASEARGHIDVWEPYFLGYEHPLEAAQAYALAYRIAIAQGPQAVDPTDAASLLLTSQRWAELIRSKMPNHREDGLWNYSLLPDGDFQYSAYRTDGWASNGAYADSYARLIDFFATMFEATSEQQYLDDAQVVANEAISKLWYKGLLRGHTMKNTYENVDGVGLLLESLLRLDSLLVLPGDFDDDGDVTLMDYEVIRNNFGLPGSLETGDANVDGVVDIFDFEIWRAAYLRHSSSVTTASSIAKVAEPTGLLTTILGATCLLLTAKRSESKP